MDIPSASPTLSNSCERPSSGSMSSSSSAVPKRSFMVFSYSRRFSRRNTVPFAAACACTNRGPSAARNAASAFAFGRSVTFAGGISPAVTRSKICSHSAKVAASVRLCPSFSRSKPPFAAPSPWQSKQCVSRNAAVGLSNAQPVTLHVSNTMNIALRMNGLETIGRGAGIRAFYLGKNS